MNFSIFDRAATEFAEQTRILEQCESAERCVQTDPHDAITNAREALELLCKDALRRKNVERMGNLSQMIELCLENNVFVSGADATIIRKCGNDVIHANLTKDYHIAREENIREAIIVMKALFCIVAETFGVKDVTFDQHKIPFGAYDVVRKVEKAPNEVLVGNWHYFVVTDNGKDYFLMQILPRMDIDLGARNEDARRILKEPRRSRFLTTQNITISPEADRQYVLYSVYRNSFLLSEGGHQLTPHQAAQVGLDLVLTLQEMQKCGIHHRNIQPGCVLLTPLEDGSFQADLVNMETAKIKYADATVYGSIRNNFLDNPYMPPELRLCEADSFTDWEKVDVYGVALVMIYCVEPDLISVNMGADDLYDAFPENMVEEIFRPVFESDLRAGFTLKEFEQLLEKYVDGENGC